MKIIIRFMLSLILSTSFVACSDNGGEGNVGWVKITQPTTMDTYTIADTNTINVSGETFISPAAETMVAKFF